MVRYKELLLLTPILHVKDSEFRPIPGHQRESPSGFHQFCWQVGMEYGALIAGFSVHDVVAAV